MKPHDSSLTGEPIAVETVEAQCRVPDRGSRKPPLTPSTIVAEVSRSIVAQNDAKRKLASALFWHSQVCANSTSTSPAPARQNVLLLGPKSCGMTSLIRASAKAVGLPCVEPDLTEFVATSLQGAPKSINDMASLLLRELRGSALPAGPIGIISLEGIEQLAITDRDSASRKEAVQAAIARMADGKTLSMAFAGKLITFDSRRIFFVASANPNGLDKVVLTRLGHCGLGFHTSGALQPVHSMNGDALSHLTQDDLIQFGFTNSFLSAFAIRAQLNHLTEEDLQQICRLESPLLTPFTQAFGRSGVLLDFGQQALKQIAKAAADLGTGAQAITTILHHVLDDIAFEIVDTATPVQKVVVQSLHSRPEIVFGPLLINPSDYSPPPAAGDEITDQVRRLFPHGLPRRPARPRSGRSTARLANRNDLAPWLP